VNKTVARTKPSCVTAAAWCLAFAVPTLQAQTTTPSSSPVAQTAWTIPSGDSIRALLAQRMTSNGVGIVVGILERTGRQVIGHGVYAKGDARKLDGDTVFQIGSLTKPFTGLLLADMVVRGEVALDDPASKYFPAGVQLAQRDRPIVLRDLARHVSGLPSMPENLAVRGQPDPYEAYTEQQLWKFFSAWQPPRAPGEGRYSNLGFALLGRLLGRRAGIEYEQLLSQRVLVPLQMTSTAVTVSDDMERRLAPGHDRYLRPTSGWEMVSMPASGSLRSSANDLLKLMAAYLGTDSTPLDRAIALQLQDGDGATRNVQTLGWTVRPDGLTFKDGGKSGYRSAAAFNRRTRTAVVVLANARTDDLPINLALHLLTGRTLEPAPSAPQQTPIVTLAPAKLDRLSGRYKLASGEVVEVARSKGHLIVHAPGNGAIELHPTSETEFFLNTGNDEYVFRLSANGRAEGVTQYGDGRSGAGSFAARVGDLE
jgi:D-alanyl-D-alanine-carboxypeptidase/D-alanyl-D-alanine-endopeptidase